MNLHTSNLPTSIPGGRYPNPQEVTRGLKMLPEEENDGYAGGEPQDGNIEFDPVELSKPIEEAPKDTPKETEKPNEDTPQAIRNEVESHLIKVLELLDKLVKIALTSDAEKEQWKKNLISAITKM